ncbi:MULTISPECIES: hypothetical protein [unclassified Streptomyces]|uniref:hypothetical protein n=1 Tax=unclassified Streptomyces TaxID=2593676 RepID=UPI000B89809E|nr:hypothetical protein [Streptomyces sp. MnatMP-M77]MYT79345.1 hypothetical protein [Streptomyces sp. SID8364]
MVVLVGLNTDLGRIKAWWRTLGGDRFAVLPPPTRGRYTQSDGHEDAAEMFAVRGIATDTSFAYWHWQSHDAFARSGELTGELCLHWGGDHATVAAGLGEGPEGYRIVNGGPRGAFLLDKVTATDADGLPDPEDTAGVRQFLARLDEPRRRTARSTEYAPLSAAEERWLHDRLAGPVDLAAAVRFAAPLEHRQALTPDETERLLSAWREAYAGRLTAWRGWRFVLPALLRQEHPVAWEVAAELGADAAHALAAHPSPRSLELLRTAALTGDGGAVRCWFRAHHALREPDPVRAAAALSEELTEHTAPETAQTGLLQALREAVVREPLTRPPAADASFPLLLATVGFATDERLPRPLRVAAAKAAADTADRVREAAGRLTDAAGAADALAAVERYEAARDGLLAGTGPDLTGYEGRLGDIYHRYRALAPADLQWLRDRVADPSTGLQGIAFCLELLLAHGEAGEAELAALLPRWKKELTKQYRTTYTEWRHPLVTLTCLALDLDHPAAAALTAWWAKPKPLWKAPVRLLTHLGAPDEEKAAELWAFIVSDGHDTGQLMTWVLLRARLDGTHPLQVAEKLIGAPGVHPYTLEHVLIGVADPAQPLWHYAIDPRSHSWLRRAQEVADDPRLTDAARAIGLKAAREHHVFRHPDQVSPALTDGQRAAALAWAEARADRTAAD